MAVLGCGPAGLLAAYAAVQAGHKVNIYSNISPSPIGGAQYLHSPVPGITPETHAAALLYQKVGSRKGYAEKVYGNRNAPCSWDQFHEGFMPAWSLRDAYEKLWRLFENSMSDVTITPKIVDRMLGNFDQVLSTIPAHYICTEGHNFNAQEIWIKPGLLLALPDNAILYNGIPCDHWYRASNIFGHEFTESTRRMAGASRGIKPLDTDCDCWEGTNLMKLGRFGQWKKGVLTHHAYQEASDAMLQMQ